MMCLILKCLVFSPPPDSKEQLEQRKEMREKHRMGFKQFLQAQRQGQAHTVRSNSFMYIVRLTLHFSD